MTFAEWMTCGAAVIAIFAAWYTQRQAAAAESAHKLAKIANRRAAKAEKRAVATANAMAWRWQTIPNGDDRYLLVNTGMNSAFGVEVILPEYMTGRELRIQAMSPLEHFEFRASIDSKVVDIVPDASPLITVRWYDSSKQDGEQWHHATTLLRNQPGAIAAP